MVGFDRLIVENNRDISSMATTRAIGCFCGSSSGLIGTPHTQAIDICREDYAILLSSFEATELASMAKLSGIVNTGYKRRMGGEELIELIDDELIKGIHEMKSMNRIFDRSYLTNLLVFG